MKQYKIKYKVKGVWTTKYVYGSSVADVQARWPHATDVVLCDLHTGA